MVHIIPPAMPVKCQLSEANDPAYFRNIFFHWVGSQVDDFQGPL